LVYNPYNHDSRGSFRVAKRESRTCGLFRAVASYLMRLNVLLDCSSGLPAYIKVNCVYGFFAFRQRRLEVNGTCQSPQMNRNGRVTPVCFRPSLLARPFIWRGRHCLSLSQTVLSLSEKTGLIQSKLPNDVRYCCYRTVIASRPASHLLQLQRHFYTNDRSRPTSVGSKGSIRASPQVSRHALLSAKSISVS
jgi:hypothetical protein